MQLLEWPRKYAAPSAQPEDPQNYIDHFSSSSFSFSRLISCKLGDDWSQRDIALAAVKEVLMLSASNFSSEAVRKKHKFSLTITISNIIRGLEKDAPPPEVEIKKRAII